VTPIAYPAFLLQCPLVDLRRTRANAVGRGPSCSRPRRIRRGASIFPILGRRVDPEATGRPSYHPSVLLKLCIYGYLNRVQLGRRLERKAGRNVEVMWLTGRLVPDHKTICRLSQGQ
jgi:Transposase domain (DUF772)